MGVSNFLQVVTKTMACQTFCRNKPLEPAQGFSLRSIDLDTDGARILLPRPMPLQGPIDGSFANRKTLNLQIPQVF
jgi:hypothetical protein